MDSTKRWPRSGRCNVNTGNNANPRLRQARKEQAPAPTPGPKKRTRRKREVGPDEAGSMHFALQMRIEVPMSTPWCRTHRSWCVTLLRVQNYLPHIFDRVPDPFYDPSLQLRRLALPIPSPYLSLASVPLSTLSMDVG